MGMNVPFIVTKGGELANTLLFCSGRGEALDSRESPGFNSRDFNVLSRDFPVYSHRTLSLANLSYSLFLFGPRQTGKTPLLRENFPHARWCDLLESNTLSGLSELRPGQFG